MHAGTAEGGGGGADDEPDPDPASYFEEQIDDGGEEETAASASVDVRPDDEATDGKPSARAAASAKGSGGQAVKRKKPKPKHQRSQKPEGYPSRNRSSYNYFFQAQRARLLEEAKVSEGGGGAVANKKLAAAGNQGADGGEAVGFENMAKTIAKRWKQLTPEELEPFQQLAKQDMARYRREMEEYQQELVRQSRLEREKSAAEELSRGSRNTHPAPAPYPAPNNVASGPAPASFHDGSPPRSAAHHADELSNLQGLLGATQRSYAQGDGRQDQGRYENFVLSHLEALLQQQAQQAELATPAAASVPNLSTGDLNFLAASALSQMLVRQQSWNPGALSSSHASASNHQATWDLSSLQQQQQNLQQLLQHQQLQQQQQQQQEQQRQIDSFTNAAQLALLHQLLNLPVPGNGGAALNQDRRHAVAAPSASAPQGHGDDSSESQTEDPTRNQPHQRRNP